LFAAIKFFESAEKDTNSPLLPSEKIALKPKKSRLLFSRKFQIR